MQTVLALVAILLLPALASAPALPPKADPMVVKDACATRNLKFGPTEVPAAQVHAAALAAMSGSYARVVSTDELLDELK
jgi:hypothetical protein